MAKTVQYKRPRKINPISVSLTLIAIALVYLAYQYFPIFLRKEDAMTVLDEYSSKFAGRRALYMENAVEREQLRRRMESQIRLYGIQDPQMEAWIEIDNAREVRFGVIYDEIVEWPGDMFEPTIKTQEVEYRLVLQ